MTAADRIKSPGPKKILAVDGGGIRGMIAVEVLAHENLLQHELGRGPDFVLADYFNFVAGTNTGAIIAACISLGMKMADVRAFYVGSGREMFDKASLLRRFPTSTKTTGWQQRCVRSSARIRCLEATGCAPCSCW